MRTPQEQRIESFLLQIYCEYLEQKVIQEADLQKDMVIEVGDLPDVKNIYEAYYERKLGELEPGQQQGAKMLLEKGLLYVNEESGESRRLSVDKDQLIDDFGGKGVNEDTLAQLKNQFLIREEPNTTGGSSFENFPRRTYCSDSQRPENE